MSSPSPTGAQAIETAQKQAQAIALRLEGLPYRAIGARMGISDKNAFKHVKNALQRYRQATAETVEEVRELELQRIDELINGLWAQRGNNRVVDTITRLMDRRAKLLGLDAPVKLDATALAALMDDNERTARVTALLDAARARRTRQPASEQLLVASLSGTADGSVP